MKIKIILVSKTNKDYIEQGLKDYTKRLSRFCDIDFTFIKEVPITGDDPERVKTKEGEKILEKIPADYYKIALEIQGTEFSSEKFAEKIEYLRDFEGGKIVFIIGGPLGLGSNVLDIADLRLSMSQMAFCHQTIRLYLLEQLYRAFTIIHNIDYHK